MCVCFFLVVVAASRTLGFSFRVCIQEKEGRKTTAKKDHDLHGRSSSISFSHAQAVIEGFVHENSLLYIVGP